MECVSVVVPRKKVVFMFSGQGSHCYQMGRALYEGLPEFRERMDYMDVTVRELTGSSVIDALYNEGRRRDEVFDRILLTHPAILMVECALAHTLMASGLRPDMVCGASLGTFAAAVVAGGVSLEDALAAVVGQARLLEECCEDGAMYAVLSQPTLYQSSGIARWSELAGTNFGAHFVVSTTGTHVYDLERQLREMGVTHQKLAVPFAFHSRWIEAIKAPFLVQLRSLRINRLKMPLVCCAGVELLDELGAHHLWRATREPVRFQQTIEHLEEQGAHLYVDVGPSGTLATFVKYLLPGDARSEVRIILSPFGQEMQNLAGVLATPLQNA